MIQSDSLQLCACIVLRPFLLFSMANLTFPTTSVLKKHKICLAAKVSSKNLGGKNLGDFFGKLTWVQQNSRLPQMTVPNSKQKNVPIFTQKSSHLRHFATLMRLCLKSLRAGGLMYYNRCYRSHRRTR